MGASQPGGQPTPQEEHDAAQGGASEAESHITGDQGEPAPIEQDAANIGMVPDGVGGQALRQSAPPASAQSGIPLDEDRRAGVEPGETSRNAAPAHEQPPVADPGGVVPGSQP